MAVHRRFPVAPDIEVYVCDHSHPSQRVSNENTTGLLRQYFLKGTNVTVYSQAKLNTVGRRLNERPRKTLNDETPAEKFQKAIYFIHRLNPPSGPAIRMTY
jgi:IS30 family transposase